MKKQRGFFDDELRLKDLEKQGDPLIALNKMIKWESFRHTLNRVFEKQAKGPGGRPAYDYVMMFKILILQRLYNLSDAQIQFQIMDRFSFMRFLGLNLQDQVPDEKTIWLFRETLTKSGKIELLFEQFRSYLLNEGIIAHSGKIVDASFVEAPKQRNTKEENEEIKGEKVPDGWEENKIRQKDVDARWVTKGGQRHYGYKNHIKIDRKSKIIEKYVVTPASVHDSQVFEKLITEKDSHHEIYADSAYSGKTIKNILQENKIKNRIHEKGCRYSILSRQQMESNRKKSKVRCRVEHVFGCIKNSLKGNMIRAIGIIRANAIIGLTNLTYNMIRYLQLCRA